MTSNLNPICSSNLGDEIPPPQISDIREISFHGVGESVTYASMPWNNPLGGVKERNRVKRSLISVLLNRYFDERRSFWMNKGESLSSSLFEISYSPLKMPRLLLNGHEEPPAVSFSHMNGCTSAAMCYGVHGVGIDVACANEFRGGYPFARAFHPEELALAAEQECQDLADMAAFVWAAKEAAVKALGCGFHLFDPLDVRIVQTHTNKQLNGLRMLALLERKPETIVVRYRPVPVKIVREYGCWVAFAVVNEDRLS